MERRVFDIPINRLFFDNAMWKWVIENCPEMGKKINPTGLPKSIEQPLGQLQDWKLDNIQKAYDYNLDIMSINIQKHYNSNGVESGYFIILDGRHRVVKAVYNKRNTINAVL